ncbi:MAG: rhomboid family intramembrane serine protease [Paludibacter sp.]|nr:rhomboid family intramembrane serine protease [Paludibacter sp.]
MNNNQSSFLSNIPPVTKNLIAINIILFLASVVTPGLFARLGLDTNLPDILGLHYWESSKFNPAQLITYAFMHSGLMHIFFNMFGLYMFGGILEHVWGTKRFLIYYLVTAVGAGIVQQIFWTVEYHSVIAALKEAVSAGSPDAIIPFESTFRQFLSFGDLSSFNAMALIDLKKMFLNSLITVGASGSVFGLLMAFGWLFPEQKLYLMFIPIPIKARIFVIIYGVIELFQGVANFTGDNVAHFAHLGGMLFGAVLILIWQKRRFR